MYITDGAFRGLRVPAGDHRIEMRFVPRILFWFGGISIAGLARHGAGGCTQQRHQRTRPEAGGGGEYDGVVA